MERIRNNVIYKDLYKKRNIKPSSHPEQMRVTKYTITDYVGGVILANNSNTVTKNLVSIVNNFYFKTKTQKTGENLQILQRQADSVKKVLDKSILFLAEKDQSIPNPNPLTKVSLVPYQKALVDVQANGAIYQEIVTQLELAKVTHRNKTPLIQIIDKPTLPLENSRLRFFECIVYGLFGGFVISIIYFSLIRFYQSLIK